MLQKEKILRTFDVVIVKVCERNGCKRVAFRLLHVFANLCGKIAALVILIIRVAHSAKVEENLIVVGELDAATIGVSDWIKRQLGIFHLSSSSP